MAMLHWKSSSYHAITAFAIFWISNNLPVSQLYPTETKPEAAHAHPAETFLSSAAEWSRLPKWLKDDRSRAGKINMRVLEGTPHTILRKSLKWIDGDLACQILLGTQMAVLDTKQKAEKLVQVLMSISVWNNTKPDFMTSIGKYEYGLNRRYWIGLSDLPGEEDHWEWKSNDDSVTDRIPLTYSFWHPNQPDHLVTVLVKHDDKTNNKLLKQRKPREHCVALWNPTFYRSELHSFNDEPCNNKYYVICDNPPNSPPPA